MSAWSMGRQSATGGFAATDAADNPFAAYIGKVVRWIPGDVLALYVAGVTAIGLNNPSVWWLVVALVLAPVVVVLSSLAAGGGVTRRTAVSAVLALIATAIWSLSVPGSGWSDWKLVADNATAVALVAAVAGLLFGLAADAIDKALQGQ